MATANSASKRGSMRFTSRSLVVESTIPKQIQPETLREPYQHVVAKNQGYWVAKDSPMYKPLPHDEEDSKLIALGCP